MLCRLERLRHKKGFTLVELIVVIAIIAILTAVVIPLVGRFSAQAAYSALQDNAKTVASSTFTSLADATKLGSFVKVARVTGHKSGGTLDVSIYDEHGDDKSDEGDYAKLKTSVINALQSALDDGSYFAARITANACDASIYSKDQDVRDYDGADPVVVRDGSFPDDEAYLLNGKAVGVSGSWKV